MSAVTVDVGVIMSAAGLGAYKHRKASLTLTEEILREPGMGLALDDKGRIRHQYETKMPGLGYGKAWLQALASANKLLLVNACKLDRGTSTQLKEEHFDPEDVKYVETAAKTDCKILVTHDPDYSARIKRILKKRLKIQVRPA